MWTLGVYVGLPITIAILIACAVWAAKATDNSDFISQKGQRWVAAIIAAATLGFAAWGFFPYNPEYHRYIPVTGTVQDVSNRIIGDGSSIEQKFVVLINGQEYGCTDTRCALIKKGDTIEMNCLAVWVFQGQKAYDCNFISLPAQGLRSSLSVSRFALSLERNVK